MKSHSNGLAIWHGFPDILYIKVNNGHKLSILLKFFSAYPSLKQHILLYSMVQPSGTVFQILHLKVYTGYKSRHSVNRSQKWTQVRHFVEIFQVYPSLKQHILFYIIFTPKSLYWP